MTERIGIYVCECGSNIGDKINIGDVIASVEGLDGVAVVKRHRLLCSGEGKEFLKEEIQKEKLSRVVVAACSPKQHEFTFMNVCEKAGLNPYLFQMTNIREQCAWVTPDKEKATEKATALIRAALRRVSFHSPLEKREIECNPDVLIIGAGITGVEASLLLAHQDRKVHLVEKLPSIGGTALKFEEVFPHMECSPCMLAPRLQEVLQNENINLITLGEVEEVKGFLGNFVVRVKKHARYVDLEKCIGCGACYEPCPVSVKNDFDEGLGQRKAIYTICAGALPNVPNIDNENCLHFKGDGCKACQEACAFEAINFEEKDEEVELKVGAIVVATGSEEFDPEKLPQFGYGKIDDVYTGLEFARLNASNGPTEGKIVLKNGSVPKAVAIIQSVGEEISKYRSEVSCLYSIKFAHYLKFKLPDVAVFEFYEHLSLPGKSYRKFYDKAVDKGVMFLRSSDVEVSQINGKPVVKYQTATGDKKEIPVDMVILAGTIVPAADTSKLAEILEITQGDEGFFEEEHEKLASVATPIEGIFIAGTCQGPKEITSSVTQALAVAGKILSTIIQGTMEIEAKTAEIDEELCGRCKLCITLCHYKAIIFDEEKQISVVQEALCRGCGTCASGCPSGAITAKHFTYEQISQELAEVLK